MSSSRWSYGRGERCAYVQRLGSQIREAGRDNSLLEVDCNKKKTRVSSQLRPRVETGASAIPSLWTRRAIYPQTPPLGNHRRAIQRRQRGKQANLSECCFRLL
jgi:hypothetical protein